MAKRKPKKRKLGRQQWQREYRERIQKEQEAFDAEAAKLRQLQPKPKSPPPEVIYMIIGNKPIRLRLCHQHNMPVYLPDIDELP